MVIYRCPYCLTEHKLSDVHFRCSNYSDVCKQEADVRLGRYKYGKMATDANAPVLPHAYPVKFNIMDFWTKNSLMPVAEKCDYCKNLSNIRLCPSCHNVLPPNISEGEELAIAVIGTYASGKSHYIAVLIDELQKHIMPEMFQGSLTEIDNSVRERYAEKYYNPLYEQGIILDATSRGDRQEPFIYDAVMQSKGKEKHITFTFTDVAGDNLSDMNVMAELARHVGYADGIILLVDPLQIGEVRNQLSKERIAFSGITAKEIAQHQTTGGMLEHVVRFIQQCSKSGGKKIDKTPIAVTISKLDTISELLPIGCMVQESSASLRDDVYDRSEAKQISEELKDFLKNYGEKQILKSVEDNFSQVGYFGVSALGDSPYVGEMGQKSIFRPKPHRVEDPLLWIMDQLGLM